MSYTVLYKKTNGLFWRKIKKVKADGFIDVTGAAAKDMRFFILDDESRVEISTLDMIFKYNKDRYLAIIQNMQRETGQKPAVAKE